MARTGSAQLAEVDAVSALSSAKHRKPISAGVSGTGVMDPATRRVKKPAALIKMDGETFTCLEQPGYPTFVPNP